MYIVKITYKDKDIEPTWFKDISKVFKEPKENTLTLIGVGNVTLVNIPYDNILFYHAIKEADLPKETTPEEVVELNTEQPEEVSAHRKVQSSAKRLKKEAINA